MDELFVGRAREVATIGALAESARRGQARTLFLTGEAGSGKTTLLQHAIDAPEHRGFRTVNVRADTGYAQVPFAPLRSGLEDLLAQDQHPSARRLDAALAEGAHGQTRSDRAACIGTLREVVVRWASRSPLLIAVDDLHAADPATTSAVLHLLHHLRGHRVLSIATCRTEQMSARLANEVGRLVDEGRAEELELGRFDDGDLGALVEARVGEAPDQHVLEMLLDRSGGLPFFAVELLDALVRSGLDTSSPVDAARLRELSMPRRVSTAVLHRVFEVGPDARQVASAISVIGDASLDRLGLLGELTGLPQRRTDTAFDRLVRARVLVADAERYEFSHSIVRDALYEDLDPTVRRGWHAQVGRSLAKLRSAARPAEVIEIAGHLRLGTGGHDDDVAALLAEAGDAVLHDDPHAAVTFYRDALARLAPTDIMVPAAQFSLARALDLAGDHAESQRISAAALRGLPAGAERERGAVVAAHAALAAADPERGGSILDRAVEETDAPGAALLLNRARLRFWQDRLEEAAADLAAARRLDLGRMTPTADVVEMHLAFNHGDAREGVQIAERLRRQLGDLSPSMRADVLIGVRIVTAFNLDPAVAISDGSGVGAHASMEPWHRAITAYAILRQGRLDEAIRAADLAAATVGERNDLMVALLFAVRIRAHAERGELAAAEAARASAADDASLLPTIEFLLDCSLARLHCVKGDPAAAVARLETSSRGPVDRRVNALAMVLGELVDAHLVAGDDAAAREVNGRLQALTHDGASTATTMHCLLAQARAEHDADAAQAARHLAVENGLALDAARALAALGVARSDADTLAAAYDELGALGAVCLQQDAGTQLRRLGTRAPRGRKRGSRLSAGEQQIARLIADGLTNRQIAEQMILSPKTIEAYVSRIYAKTGWRSRVDVAVAVQRGDLTGLSTDEPAGQ